MKLQVKCYNIYMPVPKDKIKYQEMIRKIIEGNKRRYLNTDVAKQISEKMKGRVLSVKTRQKMSLSSKGLNTWMKGRKMSEETRKKIKETMQRKGLKPPLIFGEKHYNWQGGITPINTKIRNSREYTDWRTAVFKRDNYTCVSCGSRGYKLNADHIKPFAYFPELRLVIDNGRTLCVPCHKKTDTFAGKVRNYKKLTKQNDALLHPKA